MSSTVGTAQTNQTVDPVGTEELSDAHLLSDVNEGCWSEIESAYQTALDFLRTEKTEDGHWIGQLSTSALSTATAISAMVMAQKQGCVIPSQEEIVSRAIEQGCTWLMNHQNFDGGWGDTDRSHSNIATTLLVIAASRLASGEQTDHQPQIVQAWKYVDSNGRWDGLRKRYGKDKTFVVPILSNCALAGLVDWKQVPALPFEAAWLPQKWYRLAKMPVVSYAIPALVAIGQAKFHFAPTKIPGLRLLRRLAIEPTLKVLHRMQPASGGYLEATPLTSFVLMNLAAIGKGSLPVSQECLKFILDSRLPDGSWPIDTNLATWGTSLAWHALSRRSKIQICPAQSSEAQISAAQISAAQISETLRGYSANHNSNSQRVSAQAKKTAIPSSHSDTRTETEPGDSFDSQQISEQGLRWLLGCQHRTQHPFTGAIPGGWGWTDLSGAVPDADDTPAALLALSYVDWQ
ncbi:MAG: prenyltransferase/squalene oxidase repeat-containing protein, partial [Pirellulales bacterium]